MNKMWGLVFFVLPFAGLAYTFWRTWCILPLANVYKAIVLGVMLVCFLMMFGTFGVFNIDRMPMPVATAFYEIGNSSIFVMLYLVMLYLLLDLGRVAHLVPRSFMFNSMRGTLTVLIVIVGVFTYGYFHYIHKERVSLQLTSLTPSSSPSEGGDAKPLGSEGNGTPLSEGEGRGVRLVLVSDLHIGYHNQVKELNRWVDMINKESPDLILIAGDIIDGRIRPLREQNMAAAFHRLKAPVVACLGNHEYYTGLKDALPFYKEAGITLLRDSAMQFKPQNSKCTINIIGRDDRTNPARKSIKQLEQGLDMRNYTILLDHQPYHLEEAQQAGIDFQFSGHTHYGQVWPISWITDAIYEDAFGPLTKGGTQYYVSSGLGIWGAKFRIGTRSEYVVASLCK